MYRLIDFLRMLTHAETTSNAFNETARWSLLRNLSIFKWRIPSVWCQINEQVKTLLDHSSPRVREHIAKYVRSVNYSYESSFCLVF